MVQRLANQFDHKNAAPYLRSMGEVGAKRRVG
ncbi:hypothetical protein X736_10070 [Mesorhizobium sp. L2C089B000]|nr:hypothetical protein X736_10070 [Mesorhizobium sp. L2C089B000]